MNTELSKWVGGWSFVHQIASFLGFTTHFTYPLASQRGGESLASLVFGLCHVWPGFQEARLPGAEPYRQGWPEILRCH